MEKTLEVVIEHYGCKSKEDLQSYLGEDISIRMLETLVISSYNKALEDVENKVQSRREEGEGDLRQILWDINSLIKKED